MGWIFGYLFETRTGFFLKNNFKKTLSFWGGFLAIFLKKRTHYWITISIPSKLQYQLKTVKYQRFAHFFSTSILPDDYQTYARITLCVPGTVYVIAFLLTNVPHIDFKRDVFHMAFSVFFRVLFYVYLLTHSHKYECYCYRLSIVYRDLLTYYTSSLDRGKLFSDIYLLFWVGSCNINHHVTICCNPPDLILRSNNLVI